MELNPSSDVWIDSRRIDARNVNIEGDFEDTLAEQGADPNTGLISTIWNSWQTDWVGVNVNTSIAIGQRTVADNPPRPIRRRVANPSRRGQRQVTTRNVTVTATDIRTVTTNVDTTTRTGQSRTGLATRVVERIDSESLGDRVVERENIPFMRSRNIEFIVKNVKPRTQLFGFFDGEDVAKFCFPKLLEVTMSNGTFQVGETIIATPSILDEGASTTTTPYIQFRVATPNHKYGPYNAPTDIYTVNPYNDGE